MATTTNENDDDLAGLSPEDRAIVERGRARLRELQGKPFVSKGLQARSESVNMPLDELLRRAEEERREKEAEAKAPPRQD